MATDWMRTGSTPFLMAVISARIEIAISILAEITAIKNGVDPVRIQSVAIAKAELARTPACSVLDETPVRATQ